MLPYGRQTIDDDDVEAVARVMRGDWLTTGPAVAAFEHDLSDITGCSDVVSVTSGTAALHVAYAAAGVGPGSRVVTSPLTFVATASCAAMLGATIDFADVTPDTGNLDPEAVEAVAGPDTRVIAAVDYAGHPVDANRLRSVCESRDALFLEDAAHSIGSTLEGRPVGSLADITTFSFFPTKNLTTAEGGAVAALDAGVAARARTFHNIGLVRDRQVLQHPDEGPWHQEVHEFGLNYRLPDVLAALGSSQLRRLDAFKARRSEIHRRYDLGLADVAEVRTPTTRQGADPMWHLYPLRVPTTHKRALFESLRERGIGVQVNYLPVYWHPVFEDLGYRRGLCPVAEEYYRQEVSLPLFPSLKDADVDLVIEAIRDYFGYSTD